MLRWSLLAASLLACTPSDDLPTETETETPTVSSAASHSKGAPNYALVFDDAAVRRLDLTVSAEHYAAMQADMTELYGTFGQGRGGGPGGFSEVDPIYVPATVQYEGETWSQVGLRYKGNSSLMSGWTQGVAKLPFRLHFDKYEDEHPEIEDQRFWGFQELKFSSAYSDASLIRDKLGSEVLRAAGVPTAKMALVRVYVDVGEGPVYWGVYTMAEDPCGTLLDSWFGSDEGNCYKPESDLRSFDASLFEKKTHEDEADFSDVQAFVAALNAAGEGEAWRSALEERFDVPGFLRYLAIHNLVQNWDAYGQMAHNYYLYADPDDAGRLTWIPWDFNEGFQSGVRRGALSLEMDEVGSGWPLIRNLIDDPVYEAAYYDELEAQLDAGFDLEWLSATAEALHALVEPYAIGEQGEQAPYTWLSSERAFLSAVEDGIVPVAEARASEARRLVGLD